MPADLGSDQAGGGIEALSLAIASVGAPSSLGLTMEEGRRNFLRVFLPLALPEEVEEVDDLEVPGPHRPIRLRRYDDHPGDRRTPIVFFHGGGFAYGDLDSHDPACRALARCSGLPVVAVDYRRAPEEPYPAALEDCWAAARYVSEHGNELLVDGSRVVLAGDSAGGNLAAAVALRARDRGGVLVALQALVYPALQPGVYTELASPSPCDPFLTAGEMESLWGWYLGDLVGDPPAEAAPGLVVDLAGLPPAYVLLAGMDPLYEQGAAYARRLREAGVPVTRVEYPAMVHGFLMFTRYLEEGSAALSALGRYVRDAVESTSASAGA